MFEDWRVVLVLITSIAAFLGVLVRQAVQRADEQRKVAATIGAYLLNWESNATKLDL